MIVMARHAGVCSFIEEQRPFIAAKRIFLPVKELIRLGTKKMEICTVALLTVTQWTTGLD
jgi:hypothetical protein